MRKRQYYMQEGARVLALGRKGTITKIIGAPKPMQEYLTAVHVLIDDNEKASKYNPFDIEPYDPNCPAQVYLADQISKKNYHNQLTKPN
ncbi:hypothetical protein [Lacinutrix sp. Hel_I_90]|uniref:hypothetical protein n=1 Tax=Lacinutrix sp. Hel_I_90 TaxID=1249999 RepID=UPI0005C86E74|nr:hypothetical protein [Lacinutrix sp. Hel_I_90]